MPETTDNQILRQIANQRINNAALCITQIAEQIESRPDEAAVDYELIKTLRLIIDSELVPFAATNLDS